MRKIILFLFVSMMFCFPMAYGQSLEGSWEGVLDVMGSKLPLVFKFEKADQNWSGFMDSPSQGAKDIPLSKVLFEDNMLIFEHSAANIIYEGIMVGEQVSGNFKQAGMSFPLDLKRKNSTAESNDMGFSRPQTPKEPFDYESKNVSFSNEEVGINLSGTLTIPHGDGPFPALILVSGSGPQDRNSSIFDHEPFWVLADFFSSNGVLVLRYDERGVGESEGDFSAATSEDFKNDAQHAISFLRTLDIVDPDKIGMLGHSEGGMIAWMMAAEAQESPLDFVISLAGPVIAIPELMAKQTEDISRSTGNPKELVERQVSLNTRFYQLIKRSEDEKEVKAQIPDLVDEIVNSYELSEEIKKQQRAAMIATFENSINPWFMFFMKYEAESDIKNIEIPVFAAFGGKDLQVNAAQNGNRLLELFKDRENLLELKVYDDLNHLFQKAETGAVSEYQQIEESFNQQVMDDILNFIKNR
ncbi:hypothetical protein A33Q_1268 [Indibacter alkaliphilus LW1]|uniref:Xaa-Pro dipeptidyl-peptidase-like domain-containing protein n=1 Tax=Indibacter alkaliphilus (strain CCUG 57479 / KCTC 22604 / LW1) TaxID=1189612 RepID=S2DI17_INDAL|nr:alpha/beta hydrolase [Indibacter alkaliphilus]EOZ98614.1 hypothetical protein A33Q_1268 [Indibacter alkaliphilus LW1]